MTTKLQEKASEAYYEGNPIITDEEYDSLFGSSGPIGTRGGDIPHRWALWSLQNYFIGEKEPNLQGEKLITPKLDGAAVSILYIDGILVRALTRGDGKLGKSILSNMLHLVPNELAIPLAPVGAIQITGEVVARKHIENARNFSAGALGLKDDKEFESRVTEGQMEFIIYDYNSDSANLSNYSEGLDFIHSFGFNTVKHCDDSLYPCDGRVFRVVDNRVYKELGFTSKHPRGAYAEKTRETPVVTKLLDVEWGTGKSGKVTPVAILEPIIIEDALISRATLNNMAYIEALGLEIGCDVNVIRAGSIIPCIVGRA